MAAVIGKGTQEQTVGTVAVASRRAQRQLTSRTTLFSVFLHYLTCRIRSRRLVWLARRGDEQGGRRRGNGLLAEDASWQSTTRRPSARFGAFAFCATVNGASGTSDAPRRRLLLVCAHCTALLANILLLLLLRRMMLRASAGTCTAKKCHAMP